MSDDQVQSSLCQWVLTGPIRLPLLLPRVAAVRMLDQGVARRSTRVKALLEDHPFLAPSVAADLFSGLTSAPIRAQGEAIDESQKRPSNTWPTAAG